MRVSHEPGYVLHTRPYRESSLLIDAFTRGHGRVTILAKGIRSLKSRQRSAMNQFSLLSLGWAGKGELPVLTQAEHDGRVNMLSGRERLCGFYVNELLSRLLHKHDPHDGLFDAYHELVGTLDQGVKYAIEVGLRLFEKNLLKEIGYAMDLDYESDGVTRIDPDAEYQYVPTHGVVKAAGDSKVLTVRGTTLLALSEGRLDQEESLRECKQLMRGIIRHHVGQKLHSRSLFRV